MSCPVSETLDLEPHLSTYSITGNDCDLKALKRILGVPREFESKKGLSREIQVILLMTHILQDAIYSNIQRLNGVNNEFFSNSFCLNISPVAAT